MFENISLEKGSYVNWRSPLVLVVIKGLCNFFVGNYMERKI